MGINHDTCICVGNDRRSTIPSAHNGTVALAPAATVSPRFSISSEERCIVQYQGRLIGIPAQVLVNATHLLSGLAVCFARSVNDTPKVAALLLAGGMTGVGWKLGMVSMAMAIGGILNSRRVAETMSNRITSLNTGQGLTGNLVTAALVLVASRWV